MTEQQIKDVLSIFPSADRDVVAELFKELGTQERVIDRLVNGDETTQFKSKKHKTENKNAENKHQQKPHYNRENNFQKKPKIQTREIEITPKVAKPRVQNFSSATSMGWGELKVDNQGNLVDDEVITSKQTQFSTPAPQPVFVPVTQPVVEQVQQKADEIEDQKQTRLFAIPEIANIETKIYLFGQFNRKRPTAATAQ